MTVPSTTTPITPPATPARGRSGAVRHGGPGMWLMGGALVLCTLLIVALIGLIAWQGAQAFWPRPIDLVTLRPDHATGVRGEQFLGVPIREEAYEPLAAEVARIEALRAAEAIPQNAIAQDDRPIRRLYMVGNRDLGQDPFVWVPLYELLAEPARPEDAVLVDRRDWGPWLGFVQGIAIDNDLPADAELFDGEREIVHDLGSGVARRKAAVHPDGTPYVHERITLAISPEQAQSLLPRLIAEARARQRAIRDLERESRFPVDRRLSRLSIRLKAAELEYARTQSGAARGLPIGAFVAILLVPLACVGLFVRHFRRPVRERGGLGSRLALRAAALIGIGAILVAVLEHPWSGPDMTAEKLEAIRADVAEQREALAAQAEAIDTELMAMRRDDQRFRVVIVEPRTGAAAPRTGSDLSDPLAVSQIVRVAAPNSLGFGGKLALYGDRVAEFVGGEPRNANQEGGVFPVIIGTVTLTLLLTVAVVPLGVIAAIYLREYARQGLLTSSVRIAVNNLAGVPSIVYGVFGLGFFCYTLGRWVDAGPQAPMERTGWWGMVGLTILFVAFALTLGLLARNVSKKAARAAAMAGGLFWLASTLLVVGLLATTPYFHGFFEAKAANNISTFRARGILWASLTLALLTLPVVIVATEEAIAAVPRSLREGSYGCGAGKWQTIWRIVLPGALPGILTGAILAVSRGAGEVAPLMLVGAAKVAPELPVTAEFPFIHAERSFMHLGFHIFDLGFQSKDPEGARPFVWATTLLLILIVLALNMAAILLRARLRSQRSGF